MTNESIEQVRAAQRGDSKAFTQLVAEYQHQACRLAFALLEEADSAEDIAQESFIEAWQQLHRLDDPAKFGPWLNTVVRNRALNQRRQDSRRSKREDAFGIAAETAPTTPESDADQAQRAAAFWRAVSQLSPNERDAIWMYYALGESIGDVAATTGASEATIKKRLSRGRLHLKAGVEAELRGRISKVRAGAGFVAMVALGLGRTASAQGAAGSAAPIIGSKSMVAVAAVAAVLYWSSSTTEDVESPPPPQQPVTAMLRVSESDSQPRAGVETATRQVVASARKAQPRMVPPATAADYASLPSRSFESQVQFADGTPCDRSFVTLKLTPFEPDPQCASIAGDRKQEVVCPDGAGSFDAFAGSPLSGRIRFASVPPGRYPVEVLCQGRGSDGAPLSLIRDFVWDARSDGDVRWTLERPEGFRNSEPKEATGVAEKRRMLGMLSKPFDAGVFDLSKAVPAASSQRNVASKRGQTQGVQIGVPGSSKGAASAPVQLLEVISTVTPFSAPVHRSMLQLVQDFPQDVQVTTYVSPLWAGETAVRALCAAEDQGGFEAYLSLLHAQPRPPGKRPTPLAEEKMLDLAAEAGLNRSDFESRFNSRYCRVYVETLGAHLEELGVKVAPAIFVNGEAFPGARSYADYRTLVESQLQR